MFVIVRHWQDHHKAISYTICNLQKNQEIFLIMKVVLGRLDTKYTVMLIEQMLMGANKHL